MKTNGMEEIENGNSLRSMDQDLLTEETPLMQTNDMEGINNGNALGSMEQDLSTEETPLMQTNGIEDIENLNTFGSMGQDLSTVETPLMQTNGIEGIENRNGEGTNESSLQQSHSSSEFENFVDVMNELERPWPATFERSISLLAGPTMDTSLIDELTKSPKITPNFRARRKVS